MKTNLLLIAFFFCLTSFGQTITLKKAIRIAKKDSIIHIHKVNRAWLSTDSTTKILRWIIEEKVNIKKEKRKASGGFTTIFANRITINASTGVIMNREKFQVARIHKTPRF